MRPQVLVKILSGLVPAIISIIIIEYYPVTIPYLIGAIIWYVVSFSFQTRRKRYYSFLPNERDLLKRALRKEVEKKNGSRYTIYKVEGRQDN